ncbi:MAG: hypothetical protein JW951_09230, partial [Lentisphaerae bacterium]|nr:hypothetical protein [Lentisphaerota bacterium]
VHGASKRVTALAPEDGRVLAAAGEADIPGGWTPEAIGARGRWAAVYDAAGQRIVRLRAEWPAHDGEGPL